MARQRVIRYAGKTSTTASAIDAISPMGKAPIYGELGDASSLGWLARHHPAQVVHKVRNGVPSADMVSLRFLDIKQVGDLLAYLQTLDTP